MGRTRDGRFVGLMLAKGRPGERWKRAFSGDPEGARQWGGGGSEADLKQLGDGGGILPEPYRLVQLEKEVVLEMQVSDQEGRRSGVR